MIFAGSLIKEEIKQEPDIIPSSPSSNSHDSWSSIDSKVSSAVEYIEQELNLL